MNRIKSNHAGERARRWRKAIGAQAERSDADMRTRKFPLEIPINAFNFDEATTLFNTVEGVGPGSLAGFLFATHLSGFRVFSNTSGAQAFRSNMERGPAIAQDDNRPFIRLSNQKENDIALYRVVAQLASEVRAEEEITEDKITRGIKQRLFGGPEGSPNGLSWLFGKGLAEVLANSEISDEEVARSLHADPERIQQLREVARTVPMPPPFYKGMHYAHFRVQVAQKLGGWIGNYWNRLGELRKRIDGVEFTQISFPPELDDSRLSPLAKRANIHPKDIRATAESLPDRFQKAHQALDFLAGHGDRLPDPEDIAKFDELNAVVDNLSAWLKTLKNIAKQRIEDTGDSEFWKKLHEGLESSLKPLEKLERLNQISGGVPNNPEDEVRQTADAFNALWQHRCAQFAQIADLSEGTRALLQSSEVDEAEILRKRGKDPHAARENAVRKLLQRISNTARNMRSENREEIAAKIRPLFANVKPHKAKAIREANKYFINNQGAIYRSPFSRSIHEPYKIDWEAAYKMDWVALLESSATCMESRLMQSGHPDDFRDWMACAHLALTMRLQALPDEISGEKILALTQIPAVAESALHFSPILAENLQAKSVPRRVVISAFNQLNSALRGLGFKIMRPDFIVRAVFHPVGQDKLIYAPKDVQWQPPSRYYDRYTASFDAMKATQGENGKLDSTKAVKALLDARRPSKRSNIKAILTKDDLAVLAELPHDWLFLADNKWRIDASQRDGIIVSKKSDKQAGYNIKSCRGLRLIGPTSLKSALDDCLRGRTTLGESSLIVECRYTQKLQWKNGELSLSISVCEDALRAEVAVPVESPALTRKGTSFYDKMVAVDLGERGIGYAVFDIRRWLENENDEPLASGTVSISSIRALIRAVRRHRGRAQPGQKIRDAYSRALEKRRKNVIGDVCQVIDALCSQHCAFPVLEGDLQNLESGENQLKLVYGSVIHRYVFSGVDAHKKQRGEHWFTGKYGGKWSHPYLIRITHSEKGRKQRKDLNLFPGTQVSPYGTSQMCSQCRRNAIQILRDMSQGNQLEFKDGKASLGDGLELRLFQKTTKLSDRELRRYRRAQRRPPLTKPLNGCHSVQDLLPLVKFNLRRPPESLRSRDTTQSQYRCVFADCLAEQHADENAAINIGRKLMSNMDYDKSKRKLA